MLEVQKYLANKMIYGCDVIGALDSLKEEFGIKYNIDPDHGIVLLDYDQINSPKTHPITVECRSLILNCITFDVVSRKFDRFFNYGEAPDLYRDFDISSADVYEKVDGSLIGIYFNDFTGNWEISTRGMPRADGVHQVTGKSFRQMVLDTIGQTEDEFQNFFSTVGDREVTYICELIGPENKIVTKYDKQELVFLAARHSESGKYWDYEFLCWYVCHLRVRKDISNIRLVKKYNIEKDFDAIVQMAGELKNLEEGFVVFDPSSGKRVKIKSQTYVQAHKLRGNDVVPTRKNLLSVIFEGEIDELLCYFPEFQKYVDPLLDQIETFHGVLHHVWEMTHDIQDQKEFALIVKDVRGSGVLFEARKKNIDPYEVFERMDISKKLRLFGC